MHTVYYHDNAAYVDLPMGAAVWCGVVRGGEVGVGWHVQLKTRTHHRGVVGKRKIFLLDLGYHHLPAGAPLPAAPTTFRLTAFPAFSEQKDLTKLIFR